MALTDINFQEAEHQNFIVEILSGVLNSPIDIIFESGSTQYPVLEATAPVGGGNIFIMSE